MSKRFEVILPNGLRQEVVLALDHDVLLTEHDAMVEKWADASTDLEYMTAERSALLAERELLLAMVEAVKVKRKEARQKWGPRPVGLIDPVLDALDALDAYNASKEGGA